MQELEMKRIVQRQCSCAVYGRRWCDMCLVEWANTGDRGSKASLEFLWYARLKSLKGTEQRCPMIHPDFLLKSHFAM